MQPHPPLTMRGPKDEVHAGTPADRSTAQRRPRRKSVYPCPRCGSKLFRMHRRLSDRLLSLIAPVRRFRCTSLQCGYECTVPKKHSSGRHAVLGIPGVIGVTLAAALAIGISLWVKLDEETIRNKVLEARSSLMRYEDTRSRGGVASAQVPIVEFKYESTVIVDALSHTQPDGLVIDFAPPLPGVAPAADGRMETSSAR